MFACYLLLLCLLVIGVPCALPSNPLNGSFVCTVDQTGKVLTGDTCKLTCDAHYTPSVTPATVTCLDGVLGTAMCIGEPHVRTQQAVADDTVSGRYKLPALLHATFLLGQTDVAASGCSAGDPCNVPGSIANGTLDCGGVASISSGSNCTVRCDPSLIPSAPTVTCMAGTLQAASCTEGE